MECQVHMFEPERFVPPEDEMQQALAALDIDRLMALIWDEIVQRGFQSLPMFTYLYQQLERIKFYEVMNTIWQNAVNDLEAVRRECGAAFREDYSWLSESTFRNGEYGDASGATVYRVVVPLRVAVQMFENASAAHFFEKGTVQFVLDDYQDPDKPCVVRVRVLDDPWGGVQCNFVEFGLSRTEDKAAAAANGVDLLEVRAVELALDYTKQDSRFMLCKPRDIPGAKNFLWRWARVLESTKSAQMQAEERYLWPGEDQRPWRFKNLQTMPVVLWLSRKQHQAGRGQAGRDGYSATWPGNRRYGAGKRPFRCDWTREA